MGKKSGTKEELLEEISDLKKKVKKLEKSAAQHKQLEDALVVSEDKVRYILENVREAFWSADLSGKYDFLSPLMERIYGRPLLEMIENPACWIDAVHPDDQATVRASGDRLLRDGQAELEYRIVLPDGTKRWIFDRKTVLLDGQGNASKIAGILYDITERKHAEDKLRESEEKYRNLIENANEAIFVAQDGQLVFLNPMTPLLIGYSGEELVSRPFVDFVHPGDRDMVIERHIGRLRGEAIPPFYSFRIIHKDGGVRWVELNAAKISWKGKPATLNFLSDITTRKQAESERKYMEARLFQSQKMEAIGTLAGGIAHDFNNILSVIIGYTELARDRSQKEKTDHYLQETLKGAERAKNLVKQILTFSRQDEHEKKPLNVKILLKEAVKFLRSSIPTTVEINSQITDEDCNILADPTQMHQIIMNLCANAAHAMKESGGTLNIELANIELAEGALPHHPELQPGHYVKLTVSDTGHGIDPAIVQNIFDPFFTTKPVDEGTGLGLSVVYGIVKSHGGAINVYSEQGKGTTLYVYLPGIMQTETSEEETGKFLLGGMERILFVDDEPSLVDIGKRILFPLGYHVTGATSSMEALEIFTAGPQSFDMVITDMTLPKMTGIDLSRKLLQIRPDIPIILCSGIKDPETEARAKSLGIKAYLTKPLTRRELAGVMRGMLGNQPEGEKQAEGV